MVWSAAGVGKQKRCKKRSKREGCLLIAPSLMRWDFVSFRKAACVCSVLPCLRSLLMCQGMYVSVRHSEVSCHSGYIGLELS